VQTIHELAALADALGVQRASGARIALVPTMGALHDGHLSVINLAQQHAECVVVSIFVNPKQFGPQEDFEAYPRPREADVAKLATAGVDILWMPSADVMYPAGFATTVTVAGLGDHLCGAERLGHFDGVATVVTKLLAQVRPDVAVFGEKDWQQLTIIRRVTADLNLGVDIIGAPIIREPDGLAMSSRNAYLAPASRKMVAQFPAVLADAAHKIAAGASIETTCRAATAQLLSAGFDRVDYLCVIDPDSLAILGSMAGRGRIVAAVRRDATRLIDNMPVFSDQN